MTVVVVVPVLQTRITCTGIIEPGANPVNVTSVPCAVVTLTEPPEPEKIVLGCSRLTVSLGVTEIASPGNMGKVGEKLVFAIVFSCNDRVENINNPPKRVVKRQKSGRTGRAEDA
jgi:hypothetical protein